MNLETFIRLVRPARIMSLVDAWSAFVVLEPTDEAILLYGHGLYAVDVFANVADKVGYGSAVVLTGVPTENINVVDRVEEFARAHEFRAWFRGAEVPGFPDDARTWVKSAADGGYGSHLPYLLEAVRRTTGPVLELGAGEFSTPAVSDECAKSERLLVTVDNDKTWLEKFEGPCRGLTHHFVHEQDPAETTWLDRQWGVVFVDHAPGSTRGKAIERARNRTEYIVVHDTEELGYGLEALLSTFPYRKDFRRVRPWTTVVSMTREIW